MQDDLGGSYPFLAVAALLGPSCVRQVGLFLCLALSIDYSFFLLTRFQESRREYPERSRADCAAGGSAARLAPKRIAWTGG